MSSSESASAKGRPSAEPKERRTVPKVGRWEYNDIGAPESRRQPGGLPDRCVVCGADSCSPVKRQFRVSIRESDYAVVRVHELRVLEGWVPLCPRHRNHFLSPLYAGLTGCGTFAAAVALTLLVG